MSNTNLTSPRCLILLPAFLALTSLLSAQQPDLSTAPLPGVLATAHRLFLGNAGDQENADCLRAYNGVYAGLKSTTRYDLVASPSDADVILELHYEIDLGQAIGSRDSNRSVRQFRVVLIDPRTHTTLWSVTEATNYAGLQKNRNKDLDETTGKLVADLTGLLSPTPTPPTNDSRIKHGLHF